MAIGGIAFRINFSEDFAIDNPENLLEFEEDWITNVNEKLGLKVKSLHYLDADLERSGLKGCPSLLHGLAIVDAARNPNNNIVPSLNVKKLEQDLIDTIFSHIGLVQQLFESNENCEKFFNIISKNFSKGENDT